MLPMLLLFCDLNTYRKYYLNRNYALILQGLGFFFFFLTWAFLFCFLKKIFFLMFSSGQTHMKFPDLHSNIGTSLL